MWECKHKFGPIKNGYQYCKHCGIAISTECHHIWETIDKYEAKSTLRTSFIYVMECICCGEKKMFRVGE